MGEFRAAGEVQRHGPVPVQGIGHEEGEGGSESFTPFHHVAIQIMQALPVHGLAQP